MHGAKDHFEPPAPPLRLVGGADEYDALAELFLGSETAAASRRAAPDELPLSPEVVVRPAPRVAEPARHSAPIAQPASVSVEALIIGHLPVRSSPWISQYARVRAERLGRPVALLRYDPTYVSLDLFGAAGSPALHGPSTDLLDAVRHARALAPEWIVQVDELSEAPLAADDRLSAITLLTSANEAAIIAAYRAIKGLTSAIGEESAIETAAPDAQPAMRIAIMGASPAEADRALARLRNACSMFLGRPLELAACVERIGPTSAATLYRGAPTVELPQILDLITRSEWTPEPAPTPQPDPAPPAPAIIDPLPAPPTPSARAESLNGVAALPSLVQFLEGHTALAARCPDDPDIELATDADGRLALLRRADTPDACQRLVAALGWARRHLSLIAMTTPRGVRIDASLEPIGRLFTAQPKLARPLLDSDVRIHALASTPGGEWTQVELN